MRYLYLLILSALLISGCKTASDNPHVDQLLAYVEPAPSQPALHLSDAGRRYYLDASKAARKEDLIQLYRALSPEQIQKKAKKPWGGPRIDLEPLPWLVSHYEQHMTDLSRLDLYNKLNNTLEKFKIELKADKNPLAGLRLDQLPDIDGSTSTKPLRIILAASLLGYKTRWQQSPGLHTGDVSYQDEYFPAITLASNTRLGALLKANAFIPNNQSAYSYPRLVFPNYLVINAISPEALLEINGRDVRLLGYDPQKNVEYKIIGYDALVAIVHITNTVDNITREQLKIFHYPKKTALKWCDIKEDASPNTVVPLWRNKDSGTAILLRDMVFDGKYQIPPQAKDLQVTTMMGVFDELITNFDAVVCSTYYYEKYIRPTIYSKVLSIDGVPPTLETISDGSYPLVAPIYAAIRKDEPKDSPARKLYDFLTTPEGQSIVKAAGYASLR